MKKFIFDTDGGGDDLWALLLLIDAHKRGEIELLGVTTCFGNTTLDHACNNVLNFLYHCGVSDIPVFKGAEKTLSGLRGLADGAFGTNGLSEGSLPQSNQTPSEYSAHEFLTQTLSNADNDISILATGPATNIARVFKESPKLDRANIDFLWFGGALFPAGGNNKLIVKDESDDKIRYNQGNITEYAEFNAVNDVPAAMIITSLQQTRVTIMPMDPCQHTVFDTNYQDQLIEKMTEIGRKDVAENLIAFLQKVIELDRRSQKMDGGTPVYDFQAAQCLLNPDLFPQETPLQSVSFVCKEELVPAFLAASDNDDFAPHLLKDHGLMSVEQTKNGDPSNIKIVAGPYTFTRNPSENDLRQHVEMGQNRARDLVERVTKASQKIIFT